MEDLWQIALNSSLTIEIAFGFLCFMVTFRLSPSLLSLGDAILTNTPGWIISHFALTAFIVLPFFPSRSPARSSGIRMISVQSWLFGSNFILLSGESSSSGGGLLIPLSGRAFLSGWKYWQCGFLHPIGVVENLH